MNCVNRDWSSTTWSPLQLYEFQPTNCRQNPESDLNPGRGKRSSAPGFYGDMGTSTTWQEYLSAREAEARLAAIRQRTHAGRPLGTGEFI